MRGPSSAANRRSMAASNALTPGELAVLTEADEGDSELSLQRPADVARQRSRSKSPVPPMPPLPETAQAANTSLSRSTSAKQATEASRATTPAPPPDGPFDVFLQVGREVKKVTIDSNYTLASMRMLFLDKFNYNPGKENFPAIYIRDPTSSVQYELEDMDEVREKSLLSLNIERKSQPPVTDSGSLIT